MQVQVRLYANFRHGRFNEQLREYPPGTTIRHVLAELTIPVPELGTVFVDHKVATLTLDRELHEGAKLGIFPLVGGG